MTSSAYITKLVVTIGSFVGAVPLGGMLAALILFSYDPLPAGSTVWPVVGVGLTFTLFGFLPAILFGVPALLLIRKVMLAPRWAMLVMAAGGAVVGAWLTTITFTGMETLGAVAGGSIGLTLGWIVYPRIGSDFAARLIN